MDATATATDTLGLSDEATTTIAAGGATGTRTVRRSLLGNRINWGSLTPGFSDTQGPAPRTDLAQAPDGPVTVSVIFTVTEPDWSLAAFRFYKHPDLTGTIPWAVWDSAGVLIDDGTFDVTADNGGWVTVDIDPVATAEDTEYVLGVYFAGNNYYGSAWVWASQDTVVPPFLVRQMFETGGVRSRGSAFHAGSGITFPATHYAANYYIDPIVQKTVDLPGYGAAYFDQFVNGGSSFAFPVGVYFADPPNLAGYKALGVNTLMAGSSSDAYIDAVKAAAMDWYPTLHGGDMTAPVATQEDPALGARIRGYLLTDEPDLVTPYNPPATLLAWRNSARAIDSTRPIVLNLSKWPVINQSFAPQPTGAGAEAWNQSWRDYAELADVLSCDQYSLAAEDSFTMNTPAGTNRYGLWAYPAQVGRMLELSDGRPPIWGIVESTSEFPGVPTPEQVRRAAWALLITGARGLVFFDHRFGDSDVTQDFAAMLSDAPMASMVQTLAALLQTLGPALHALDAGLVSAVASSGTLAAAQGGYAAGARVPLHYTSRQAGGTNYVFAQAIRAGATTGTFTAPSAAGKTLTVIGESRTVVANGSGVFSDSFAADYGVHLYSWAP